jgi:hypothetical protein
MLPACLIARSSRPTRLTPSRLPPRHPTPFNSSDVIVTDNQIIRLHDGSLLGVKDGATWRDFGGDLPPWKDELVTGAGLDIGQCRAELFLRSTDCGATWQFHLIIDYGCDLGGKYGVYRPTSNDSKIDVPVSEQGTNLDGSKKWWIGGETRTEIYSCPFTGFIYMTTRIISSPYLDLLPKYDPLLLLYSKDLAKT